MAIGKISEELKSAQDYMFDNITVPVNTTTTGDANLVGGTQAQLEIVAVVGDTDIVITDLKVFTVNLTASATSDGTFVALDTMYTVTASGATTLVAGTELGRYVISPSDPLWTKAVAISDDTLIVGTLDVYIRRIAK